MELFYHDIFIKKGRREDILWFEFVFQKKQENT